MEETPVHNSCQMIWDDKAGEAYTLHISGEVSLKNLMMILNEINRQFGQPSLTGITVDLSGVTYLDSAGAMALRQLHTQALAQNITFKFINMSEEASRIFSIFEHEVKAELPPAPATEAADFVSQVKALYANTYEGFLQLMLFVGEIVVSLALSLRHPASIRWDAVLFYMKRAGADGLPIVGLISLLLGLIMAFMASLQLRQFGANIYVASLVSIAIVKELGPIMTAILVAGRSGSAFAAEIGTMMVNEEVDALVTMGFDPNRFLVIPKVLAAIIVVPVLTIYADLLGITGGLIVGVTGLDLTFHAYMTQTMNSMQIFDIVSSLVKSVCFALLISGIVCHRGFQVKGGAEAVGEAATSAVVSAIFLIILCDSAFAIMLHYIRD